MSFDVHDIRMAVGTSSMTMVDAIDEDFLTYLTEARDPLAKAFRRLTDAGVDERAAISGIHGFVATVLDDARE